MPRAGARGQNAPLGKKVLNCWRCAFYNSAASRASARENGCTYDGSASGSIIYAYVGGNPLRWVDPFGLELMPISLPGIGNTYLDNSVVPSVQNFINYAKKNGVNPNFNSAYRTPLKQQSLLKDPKAITPASNSLHSCGYAFDVDYNSLRDISNGLTADQQRKILRDAANKAGLSWGGAFGDGPHFYTEPSEGRSTVSQRALEEYNQFKRETRSWCASCE